MLFAPPLFDATLLKTSVSSNAGGVGALQLESPAYAGVKQQQDPATAAATATASATAGAGAVQAPNSTHHSQVVSQNGATSGMEYTYDYNVDDE